MSNSRFEWHLSVISAWALFVVRSTVQGKCESLEGGTTTRGSRFFMSASEWNGLLQFLWTHKNVSNHIGLSSSAFRDNQLEPKGMVFNLKFFIMNKNGKNEELQSRREFFKKAAKGALPILGAIVLAGTPTIAKAVSEAPMGCQYSCTAWCADNCSGKCQGSCTTACSRGCSNYCNGGCSTTCRGVSY